MSRVRDILDFGHFVFSDALNHIYPPEKAYEKLGKQVESNLHSDDNQMNSLLKRYVGIYYRSTIRDGNFGSSDWVKSRNNELYDVQPWESRLLERAKDDELGRQVCEIIVDKIDILHENWSHRTELEGKSFEDVCENKITSEKAKDVLYNYLEKYHSYAFSRDSR